MKLLPLVDYLHDAATEIRHAKRRVFVMTLGIANEQRTHEFMHELLGVASRGVECNVAADLFVYSEFGGHFSPLKRYSARSRAVTTFTHEMEREGVNFTWLGGNHRFNPFAGVTHIKWTIVDDTVYTFGGVNLYGRGATNVDYMLKIESKPLANTLVAQHKSILKADQDPTSYRSFKQEFDFGTLMIDGGQRGDSVIYDRAVGLAKQCESLVFVSQYCPTGPLAALVKEKATHTSFNRPPNAHFLTNLMIRGSMLTTGLKTEYTSHRYLHAKFIIFTMPSGEKIALSGSHNYSYGGVRLGTREVALETKRVNVIKQLEDFSVNYVA